MRFSNDIGGLPWDSLPQCADATRLLVLIGTVRARMPQPGI